VFGPATPASFAEWAGVGPAHGRAVFDGLAGELVPVRAPMGDAWILGSDEPTFLTPDERVADARLLPSGDAWYLLHGAARGLLVPDVRRRGELWTSRVWPGAVVVRGEIAGTWRRAQATLSVSSWRKLSPTERDAVEAEAASLPLPGLGRDMIIRWDA
jgi:hypothetical protein